LGRVDLPARAGWLGQEAAHLLLQGVDPDAHGPMELDQATKIAQAGCGSIRPSFIRVVFP
jgi:hypothetical protein